MNPMFRVSAKNADLGAILAQQRKGQAAIIREVKRQTKEPVYCFTHRQMEEMQKQYMEEAKKQATADAMRLIVAAPLLILHMHFGFGEKRLNKFIDNVSQLYRNIEGGVCTLQDVIDEVHDELGITIRDFNQEEKK